MATRRFRRDGFAAHKPFCWPTKRPRDKRRPKLREHEMRLGIATDHGGFELKEELAAYLRKAGHEVVDMGAFSVNPGDDYPDFVIPLARAVAAGKVERGIAVCG